MRSMDSILADEPSVVNEPEAPESDSPASKEESPAEKKTEAKAPVEAKDTKPKYAEEDEEEHTPEDLEGLKRALKAARGDKRRARKQWRDVERQFAEFRGRFAAVTEQRQQPTTEQPKSPEEEYWSDPAAYTRNLEARIEEKIAKRERAYSVARAKSEFSDYEEVVQSFAREIAGTSLEAQINAQLSNHPDPARHAYMLAKNFRELDGVSSVEALREKIRAEIRAEMEAERQPARDSERARPPIPKPSIAGARGNGAGVTAQWTGPRSWDEILR